MKNTLVLSVASIVNMGAMSKEERRDIFFDKETAWVGSYSFNVYEDERKTNLISLDDYLTVVDTRITLDLDPTTQGISGLKYFELMSIDEKTILIKGNLNIVI